MKKRLSTKILSFLVGAALLLQPYQLFAQDEMSGGLDDSLRDITVVLATGAAGAILGLSTLSFADKPKDKLRNIAVGGALGIVIGVGVVVYSQATKSQSAIVLSDSTESPPSAEKVASLARLEFSDLRIASDYKKIPTIGFNFSF